MGKQRQKAFDRGRSSCAASTSAATAGVLVENSPVRLVFTPEAHDVLSLRTVAMIQSLDVPSLATVIAVLSLRIFDIHDPQRVHHASFLLS